ncbi:DNA polymerase III subunit gamma/tau [Paraglaciecola hydrolytica]|uniref:DNA polymerase III subunit gamma/tau n=1 Tax=Paraglaciecola hydrolytica TaxID=1799789 RepID=A0A148KLH2_9ALTE|nr:DNA polymerase III subunit gamma/tau [Paraglaciecola hydrolytica]KXI27174.1 DNA polymerase III subunit gamma/tau [Paraglaciecola hydrolytica]
MSYQVLARKWRPNCFAELVGQEHVVTAISNALDNNRLHHAYLFTGTRGVGKTTIARIFSKSLNCETGLTATPCGKCSTCVEIEQGNFIDLLEIDAASRTKVEDTRELLDNVQYRPSRGRYKVYLIDEVHMLSKHSFNALLKTLEEPPPHVKFLLATTDPQKLPVTILSRCLQFNLKALSRTQIAKQLDFILQQEQLTFDAEALSQLARAAQGSMRDALSLTDQAIAQGNGVVSLPIVTAMLGLMDKNLVLKLLNAVLQKNSAEMMDLVEHMSMQAADFSQVLAELMSLLHQVALTQMVPEACKLETIAARAIFQLAKAVAPEHIQLLYQIVLNGKKDLAHAADPRSGVEMTLLRMLAFCPDKLVLTPLDLASLAPQPVPIVTAPQVEPRQPEDKQQDKQPLVGAENPPIHTAIEAPPVAALQAQTSPEELVNQAIEQPQNTEYLADEADYYASAVDDDEQQDSANSDYEQDLFEQQQEIFRQIEDYGYTALVPTDEVAGVDNKQQNQHLAPELSSPTSLSNTEAMLALRKKLLQEQALVEESETKGKKSEPSAVPNLASLRPTNFATEPSVETKPAGIESPPLDIPTSGALPTADAASPIQSDKATLPPWSMTEVEHSSSPELVEEVLAPLADIPQQEVYMPFDTHGHLALDKQGEVNLEIPVFLQDEQKVQSATQLDDWSRLIDSIHVTALTKQLALHSSFAQQGNVVRLVLLESKQHLNTPSAQKQLNDALSAHLGQTVELEIELGNPINTPFAIQQKIQQIRQDYAHQVISSDSSVALMEELFAAKVDKTSIQAR